MFNFQNALKLKLKKLGISMRSLSLDSGLNEHTIKKMMQIPERSPRFDTVERIIDAMPCQAWELLPPEWKPRSEPIDLAIMIESIMSVVEADKGMEITSTPVQLATSIALVYDKKIKKKSPNVADVLTLQTKSDN